MRMSCPFPDDATGKVALSVSFSACFLGGLFRYRVNMKSSEP